MVKIISKIKKSAVVAGLVFSAIGSSYSQNLGNMPIDNYLEGCGKKSESKEMRFFCYASARMLFASLIEMNSKETYDKKIDDITHEERLSCLLELWSEIDIVEKTNSLLRKYQRENPESSDDAFMAALFSSHNELRKMCNIGAY